MRGHVWPSLFMLATLLAGACHRVTEPAELPVVLNTELQIDARTPAMIQVEGRRIVVRGILVTPDPCYSFAARAAPRGQTLELRLEARPVGVPCIQPLGRFGYELAVHDVPAGRWLVRLDATERGRATVTRLVEGAVTVP